MHNTNAEFLKYAYALGAAQAMADAEKEAGLKGMLRWGANAGRGVADAGVRGAGVVANAGRGVADAGVRGAGVVANAGRGVANAGVQGAVAVGKGVKAVGKGAHNVMYDPRFIDLAYHVGQSTSPGGAAANAAAYGVGLAYPRYKQVAHAAGEIGGQVLG